MIAPRRLECQYYRTVINRVLKTLKNHLLLTKQTVSDVTNVADDVTSVSVYCACTKNIQVANHYQHTQYVDFASLQLPVTTDLDFKPQK